MSLFTSFSFLSFPFCVFFVYPPLFFLLFLFFSVLRSLLLFSLSFLFFGLLTSFFSLPSLPFLLPSSLLSLFKRKEENDGTETEEKQTFLPLFCRLFLQTFSFSPNVKTNFPKVPHKKFGSKTLKSSSLSC